VMNAPGRLSVGAGLSVEGSSESRERSELGRATMKGKSF
jgi:hypothetical protein